MILERYKRRIIAIIIMALTLLAIAATCLSCKSKKKLTEREKYSTNIAKVKKVNTLSTEELTRNETTAQGSNTIKRKRHQAITGKRTAGTDKPIIFEDEDGKQTKVYNVDEATLSESDEASKTNDTLTNAQSENSTKKDQDTGTTTTNEDTSGSKRNSNTDIKATSTWVSVGFGLLIIVVGTLLFLFIYFRIKRGTDMPH